VAATVKSLDREECKNLTEEDLIQKSKGKIKLQLYKNPEINGEV